MSKPPCRLFVIPAARAPVAAILRRGPSDWYQLIRWDISNDTFEDGAWFKGRIYEEKCDLSPDGELFVYSCHGGAMRPGYTDSWTAVSRLPWLFALGLWPQGTTYGGGGRFIGDRELMLRGALEVHPDHPGKGLKVSSGSPALQATADVVDGADWCGTVQGSLVFARGGKLFRVTGETEHEIADFNGRTPAPAESPPEARRTISTAPRTKGH